MTAHPISRFRRARALFRHPSEGAARIRNRLQLVREEATGRSLPRGEARRLSRDELLAYADERFGYASSDAWEADLHSRLGLEWPCEAVSEFKTAWAELASALERSGHRLGTGHDADPAFARGAFCLTRHLAPRRVVETGVARGITSALVLHALEINGKGHLWSIDLPPLSDSWRGADAHVSLLGDPVRWTLLRGSSRRHLPSLLRRHGTIDLFLHDSLHTERSMRFELETAWRFLRRDGAILADDIHYNAAFAQAQRTLTGADSLVAPDERKVGLFGILIKT